MSAEEIAVSPSPVPPRAPGRFLTLVGLTPDGRRLRLADLAGNEFTVDVDARLRAALGVTPTPPVAGRDTSAPVETRMDSMLRPRDIQARIRAGESAEAVAAAAGSPVEKIMAFAAPVLAEREHMADRAQKSSIRRPAGSTSEGHRTLGDAVTAHLHGRNVDADAAAWDSWRREDGRWALSARYSVQGREGLAELTFDPRGNFVVLENDDARWLVGELPDPVAAPAEPEAEPGAVRRLSAVRDDAPDPDQLELGDDVLGLVAPEQPASPAAQPLEVEATEVEVTAVEVDVELDLSAPASDDASAEQAGTEISTEDDAQPELPVAEEPEPPARRTVKKTRGRASVPSWDEIMFGGGPGDSR